MVYFLLRREDDLLLLLGLLFLSVFGLWLFPDDLVLGPRFCLFCFFLSASSFWTSDADGMRAGQSSGVNPSSVRRGIFLLMSFSISLRNARSLLQTRERASPLSPALPVRPMRWT